MKSSIPSSVLLALSATSFSLAATVCDSSTALEFSTSSSDCNGDATCLELWNQGRDNAQCLIDDSCETITCDPDIDPTCLKKRAVRISKRATGDYTCDSSSICYTYQGGLFCLDPTTGDYDDEYGGTGNILTGEYTPADSSVQADSTAASTAASSSSTGGSAESTSASSQAAEQTGAASRSGMSSAQAGCVLFGVVGLTLLMS